MWTVTNPTVKYHRLKHIIVAENLQWECDQCGFTFKCKKSLLEDEILDIDVRCPRCGNTKRVWMIPGYMGHSYFDVKYIREGEQDVSRVELLMGT